MLAQLLGLAFLYFPSSLVTFTAHALQINHTGEVVYHSTYKYGVVDKAVILECGTEEPDLYIWSFTKPGTEAIKAVVYNLGKGPKIQKLAKTLGQPTVISNSASLIIEKLPLAAQGLFTCQAFYDIEEEPVVYYYYVHLTVQVPVSKPDLLVSDASPVEGSTMWMHCLVENGTGPIQYVWHHETPNENITQVTESNSSIINVTDINRNHTGWYRCVASNPVNSESSDRLWLDIMFGPDVPQLDVTPNSKTERGYSVLERETVSLLCQAQSNPASQYIWFYNDSQVFTEPQFTISKILRMQTGDYTCLAKNSYLNTSSRTTISLAVYYPPGDSISCTLEPALNHTSLRLLCSWPGGFPSPSLRWTGDLILATQTLNSTSSILLPSEKLTSNNTLFTCRGSHPTITQLTECSTHTYIPPAAPVCFANASNDKQYLILSCSWDGGVPKALVWWDGPGGQSKGGEEASNILILRYGTAHSGKPYICYAKHPLLLQPKTCELTFVSVSKPNLLRSDTSPVEGSKMWMLCKVENGSEPIEYMWQYERVKGNFTTFAQSNNSTINLTNVDRNFTGWYRCVASNAANRVGSDPLWLNITFGPDVPQIDVSPQNKTERGYSALETETVSLSCQAQSNPASQYVWFYNDSQVFIGPQFTIAKILRLQTGDYTCLAQNSYLNTSSRTTISLTVYYPPDGSPSCSVEPALNYTSLRLLCSLPGGFPAPSLHWIGDLTHARQEQVNKGHGTNLLTSTNIWLPSGDLIPDNGLFTCMASHPALKTQTECKTSAYIPPAVPVCFSNVTNDKKYLKLSCSWDGGAPAALVWWEGPAGQFKEGEKNSNILVLSSAIFHFGRPYTCYARHPLLVQDKTCSLTLVAVTKPNLLMNNKSPLEGFTIWMYCNVENGTEPIQYEWQHEAHSGNITTLAQGNSSNITITNIDRNDRGWYRCVASNFISSQSSDWSWLDIIFGPDVPQIDVTPHSITERGYSALETETVSLLCQAQSSPVSRYDWFYNNSQVFSGQRLTITKILRMQTGDYTCLAQNAHLNTRSRKSISLTVYYPPDGSPSCSVEPALNHTSLRLLCSWPGGFPSASLHWTEDVIHRGQEHVIGQQTNPQSSAAVWLPSGGLIPNNSLFTCLGFHPTLKQPTQCNTRTYTPPADPVCFAYVTNTKQYLMLSCSWDGGAPKALVWWEGPGGQIKGGEENSNILILRYGSAPSETPYTCYAKHPLLLQPRTCRLTLEAPVLLTQRRVVSVYEGSDVQLTCNLRANYLPANEITWFNNQGVDVQDTSKYVLLRTSAWANLTVRDTDEMQDSGEYKCSTSNAVGGAEINVTLVVKKHPMPPNATLVRVTYNSRQRNEVELEWQVEKEEDGGWTGFFLEHRWLSERRGKRGEKNNSNEMANERVSQDWFRNIIQDPDVRSHTVRGLTPTFTYEFRIRPINHRTVGHPSVAKTPVELHNNVYPAVIGAAVGGMLFAAIPTLLLLVYIIRNRNNNPRLHDMLFGSRHSQSRENINFPDDDMVSGSGGGMGNSSRSSSPGPTRGVSQVPPSPAFSPQSTCPIIDNQALPT